MSVTAYLALGGNLGDRRALLDRALALLAAAPRVRVRPVLQRRIGDLLAALLGVRLAGPGPARELAGLRAAVTGASSGIGRAVALELAAGGADVIVHGRRPDAAAAVVEEVRRAGVRA